VNSGAGNGPVYFPGGASAGGFAAVEESDDSVLMFVSEVFPSFDTCTEVSL
jgi:hypothetical protein